MIPLQVAADRLQISVSSFHNFYKTNPYERFMIRRKKGVILFDIDAYIENVRK